ncbi:hypothetical protein ACFYW6_17790 [Streptomyces sp. NPDC002659]|uniref:hypothetical protein n=1 Tax=Streptomyces sp. NPDC002659 TaxID=3364656 RepID=UPI0036A32257
MRRNDTTGELAWHWCWTPRPVPMRGLVHGRIAVTLAETRRLFTTLLARTTATTEQILAWSRWRRRH